MKSAKNMIKVSKSKAKSYGKKAKSIGTKTLKRLRKVLWVLKLLK